MHFQSELSEEFLNLFERVKDNIRNFPGCKGLLLLRDKKNPEIMFTYSQWESENDLEAYRNSELFAATWKDTKNKFAFKAEAWTVEVQSYTNHNKSTATEF
jgi:heme-degrading monooxygenase HmoA